MSVRGLGIFSKDTRLVYPVSKFIPPVDRGLVQLNKLGGSLAASVINHAAGYQDAIVVGTPGVQPNYLELKSKSNFLRLQRLLPGEWTFVAIYRSLDTGADAAHQPVIIGTSGVTNGGNLYQTATNVTLNSYQGGVSESSTLAGAIAAWKLVIVSADANTQAIYNMTLGTTFSEPQVPVGPLDPSTLPPGIGSGSGAGGFTGESHIAFIGIHEVVLTSDERAAYLRLRPYYSKLGITI